MAKKVYEKIKKLPTRQSPRFKAVVDAHGGEEQSNLVEGVDKAADVVELERNEGEGVNKVVDGGEEERNEVERVEKSVDGGEEQRKEGEGVKKPIDGGEEQKKEDEGVKKAADTVVAPEITAEGSSRSNVSEIRKEGSSNVAGISLHTAIVLSPSVNIGTPGSARNAILISPTARADPSEEGRSANRPFQLSPLPPLPHPLEHLSNVRVPFKGDGMTVPFSNDLVKVISELSAAVKERDRERKGKAIKVESGLRLRKERDNRPGMFTPPPFNIMSQSTQSDGDIDDMNVDSSPDKYVDDRAQMEPIDAVPLAWDPDQGIHVYQGVIISMLISDSYQVNS